MPSAPLSFILRTNDGQNLCFRQFHLTSGGVRARPVCLHIIPTSGKIICNRLPCGICVFVIVQLLIAVCNGICAIHPCWLQLLCPLPMGERLIVLFQSTENIAHIDVQHSIFREFLFRFFCPNACILAVIHSAISMNQANPYLQFFAVRFDQGQELCNGILSLSNVAQIADFLSLDAPIEVIILAFCLGTSRTILSMYVSTRLGT